MDKKPNQTEPIPDPEIVLEVDPEAEAHGGYKAEMTEITIVPERNFLQRDGKAKSI